MTRIARRYDSEGAKRRILSACVRLFIEQGYRETTMAQIIREADVSASTFQNIFKNKSGVLYSLTQFMFENQFAIAREIVGDNTAPATFYAVETALQLSLAEINESVRENYLEAYTTPEIMRFINRKLSAELYALFGAYRPQDDEEAFYQLEIGTSGVIRAYMAAPCDETFPLEVKVHRFLEITLPAFCIPEEERRAAVDFVAQLDMHRLTHEALEHLFSALAIKFDFALTQGL